MRSDKSIIRGMRREHDRLIKEGRELERQLADERARIDCSTRGGWLSEDLECAGEDGPACWKHLLKEAQGKLDAVEWAGRDDLGVACCPTCGFRRAQGHAVTCNLARILKGE